MDMQLREQFLSRWKEYFGGAELPITFQYTNNGIQAEPALASTRERCMIHMLEHVREGKAMRFFARSFACTGGKYYTGFATHPRPDINEFLSCGVEGELKGERYKRTPEIASQTLDKMPWYEAPAPHMVFKRWDKLDEHDDPEVAIFFASPDVLSGLFTLAGFDEPEIESIVIAPFGSGCASIIQFPYVERMTGRHRAVIGMFDISARPWVGHDNLTFAVSIEKLTEMVNNMPESFLITPAWQQLRRRIRKSEHGRHEE